MKIKFLKLKNWFLLTIMGMLGVSGCKSTSAVVEPEKPEPIAPREEIRLMYGVPTMNYMIRGQVRDAEGRPLGDIRVNMLERNMETTADSLHGDPERVKQYLELTAVATDSDGRFTIQRSDLPQEQVRLLLRDVDGEVGGAHKNRLIEVNVTPESIDKTNAGGWNQGTFQKDLEISLESK
jgi:putative lipoprotein (rSAM/lipoprotein system)